MFKQLLKVTKTLSDAPYFQMQVVRNVYPFRGKAPGEAKTLARYLEEQNVVDPEVDEKIDIGLPPPNRNRKEEMAKQSEHLKTIKNNPVLEKYSRDGTLKVDIEDVRSEWIRRDAPLHIKMAAEHYGVYNDLFGDAHFTPYVDLNISYRQKDGKLAPVFRGNVIKPHEAVLPAEVEFTSNPDDLWTLILTTPDGHLTAVNKEYVHWFVGNIPGNNVAKGETVWDYLQPFPALGVGFQRFIFILYKQTKKIDYSKYKQQFPCLDLEKRTFVTRDFYESKQDVLTPAGLAFFQSDWDHSVREVFHKILKMEEPRFEYDFTKPYVNKAKWFPQRKPFNMYLDKYRDPRDIAKGFLLKKLENLNPFERPQKPFPYPNVHKVDRNKTPTWLITEERRVKLGLGRINHQKDDD